MRSVVFYDCEFLTEKGAPQRFWSGPSDPDPITIQIGAVRLDLSAPYTMSDSVGWVVRPVDRDGIPVMLSALTTELTGLTEARIASEGLPLVEALRALGAFAGDDLLFAWGKDELLTIAPSLFLLGASSPIPAARFRNATPLMLVAGESEEDVHRLRSPSLCAHFGLPDVGRGHDACADAQSVAVVFQHLLRLGRLSGKDFAVTTRA